MKAVRYLLIAIVAIIALVVVAIAIAMAVINPNDYKPQIEQAVEKQTNLDLVLEGDIGWSFIPLGLELNTFGTISNAYTSKDNAGYLN